MTRSVSAMSSAAAAPARASKESARPAPRPPARATRSRSAGALRGAYDGRPSEGNTVEGTDPVSRVAMPIVPMPVKGTASEPAPPGPRPGEGRVTRSVSATAAAAAPARASKESAQSLAGEELGGGGNSSASSTSKSGGHAQHGAARDPLPPAPPLPELCCSLAMARLWSRMLLVIVAHVRRRQA